MAILASAPNKDEGKGKPPRRCRKAEIDRCRKKRQADREELKKLRDLTREQKSHIEHLQGTVRRLEGELRETVNRRLAAEAALEDMRPRRRRRVMERVTESPSLPR